MNMKSANYFPLFLLLTLLSPALRAQVLINEYSCANLNQFADNYGKHEDWIELYNAGATAVDLPTIAFAD